MRTTLQIDDDVLDAARQLSRTDGRRLGTVISELARRSLLPAQVRTRSGLPAFDVPPDAPAITSADVARALDER